ncbi:MAG: AAA family ATPase [Bacteroidetes bacterium]|jgi:shikimate kinase|nr:AAA family ATPase [Bacteroidota bacterium]
MRIYLVGYMGSGKTTVSKKLASLMGLECYDLDQLFEERFKIEIANFFDKYDEGLFRNLESQLLKETVVIDNAIIATGGGTPCFYDNMEWMNNNGITVYLQMHPLSIVSRLSSSRKKRPLLASKSNAELIGFIKGHLRQRNIFYSQAQIIIKAESIDLAGLSDQIKTALAKKQA